MKTLVVTLLLLSANAFASKCIVLENYTLNEANHSASEISAFKVDKMKIYREFILFENKIVTRYSTKMESLYETESSDTELERKLKELMNQKQQALNANCQTYKNKLENLVKTF